MERFKVYLLSGRVLDVDAFDKAHANRLAIVWHQHTDAVELVEHVKASRGKEQRVVRVLRPSQPR